RKIADDQIGPPTLAGRLGKTLRSHVADVEALDGGDAGVGGDDIRELSVADVDGEHPTCTALAEHLGESAGGGAHVQRQAVPHGDVEAVERRDQLVRSPADVVIVAVHADDLVVGDRRGRLHDRVTVDAYAAVRDQRGCVRA